jgi:hypothetical protein
MLDASQIALRRRERHNVYISIAVRPQSILFGLFAQLLSSYPRGELSAMARRAEVRRSARGVLRCTHDRCLCRKQCSRERCDTLFAIGEQAGLPWGSSQHHNDSQGWQAAPGRAAPFPEAVLHSPAPLAATALLSARFSHTFLGVQAGNKKRISAEEWQRKLREVRVAKEDMNRVVMNFLVTEVGRDQLLN